MRGSARMLRYYVMHIAFRHYRVLCRIDMLGRTSSLIASKKFLQTSSRLRVGALGAMVVRGNIDRR
jgi:hypothetical protein